MAFRVRMDGLNHSPDWYEEHCRNEDACASVNAMLKHDMAYIAADNDSTVHTIEKIPTYKDQWDAILKGEVLRCGGVIHSRRDDILQAAIYDCIARENADGFNPKQQYKDEPFKTIDDLMTDYDLSANTIREFLKWRRRRGVVAKRKLEPVKEDPSKIATRKALRDRFIRPNPFFGTAEDLAS